MKLFKSIRNVFRGIKNIIRWLPVIYKDRDWDQGYIFELLYFKLKNMQEFFESDNTWSADTNKTAKQIMVAKSLCKRIVDNDYLERALTDYHLKYGKDCVFHSELSTTKGFHTLVWDWSEQQSKEFGVASEHSRYMELQDINYLFEFLRKHIRGWWD